MKKIVLLVLAFVLISSIAREKKGEIKMLDKFIESVREEKNGFSFDKPWRLEEKSLGVVVPILRKSKLKRDYITLVEASKIKIEDTGQIDYVYVRNDEDKPVLISRGEIFRGKTQTRAAVHDHIIMPDSSLRVAVRCVFASKGIVHGTDMDYGGRIPYSVDMSNQAKTWNDVQSYTSDVKSTLTICADDGDIDMQFHGAEGDFSFIGADDLASTISGLSEALKEVLQKVPYIKNQVGAVFFRENSILGLDVYDLPDSWDVVKKDVIEKEGSMFLEKDTTDMFEFKPEKASELLKKKLAVKFDEKIIYDRDYTVIEIRADKLIGEGVIFKNKVIHLTLWKLN